LLQSSEKSVAEAAHVVGSGSEAAFNCVFKREYGGPPAKFRKERRNNGVSSSKIVKRQALTLARNGNSFADDVS
jgi:AraC-like DNA-binding protein